MQAQLTQRGKERAQKCLDFDARKKKKLIEIFCTFQVRFFWQDFLANTMADHLHLSVPQLIAPKQENQLAHEALFGSLCMSLSYKCDRHDDPFLFHCCQFWLPTWITRCVFISIALSVSTCSTSSPNTASSSGSTTGACCFLISGFSQNSTSEEFVPNVLTIFFWQRLPLLLMMLMVIMTIVLVLMKHAPDLIYLMTWKSFVK